MEYILTAGTKGMDFDPYAAYVASIRDQLPAHVYAFASDPAHFNLTSASSLHDAWLESVTIREIASGKRNEIRRTEISISLLGPCHDRRIHLHYTGVTRYSLDRPSSLGRTDFSSECHEDLHTHEVRLGKREGLLVHEILFQSDAVFLIECGDIQHSEEMLGDEGQA